MYFNPNCISRLLVLVDVMRPKVALPTLRSGALNWELDPVAFPSTQYTGSLPSAGKLTRIARER